MAAGIGSGRLAQSPDHGPQMVKLQPVNGFAAESGGATVLMVAAHYGMPVSHHARHHDQHHGRRLRQTLQRALSTWSNASSWAWLTLPPDRTLGYLRDGHAIADAGAPHARRLPTAPSRPTPLRYGLLQPQ